MTEANRRAIYDAARARERGEQQPETQGAAPIKDARAPLADLIPRLRKENKLVGLAAMAMVDGKVVESAVDGERRNGSGVPLEIGDRWHLGSITKSITATMIARLIASGQLQWPTILSLTLAHRSGEDQLGNLRNGHLAANRYRPRYGFRYEVGDAAGRRMTVSSNHPDVAAA